MKRPDITYVTLADQNYFWGLYILAASLQRWNLSGRLLIFHTGLDKRSEEYLSQFPNVELRQLTKTSPFGLHCRKPEVMLEAEGEYIGWLDSDCMIVGDLNEWIIPANGELQARLRTSRETTSDLERFYQEGEKRGGLPRIILDRWREDVGERETPRIDAMVPSNVLILHSRFKPFLEHWERQMHKVLDPSKGTLDLNRPAYLLTDESVLNSLLTFADFAPEVSEYKLNLERERHIAHFMSSPKPWVRWLPKNLYCLPFILELLDWLKANKWEVPPIPPSLQSSRKNISIAEAHVLAKLDRAQVISKKLLAKLG